MLNQPILKVAHVCGHGWEVTQVMSKKREGEECSKIIFFFFRPFFFNYDFIFSLNSRQS